MFLTRNTSNSIVEQNGCKNKTTWLTQKASSKYFFSLHIAYIEDIKGFLKDFFFVQNLFYIKKFSSDIVCKFSKNLKLKIVNDPKIG